MKAQLVKGSTSVILTVFIQDSSSTTGAGLGSLDQTSSIVGGYVRAGGTGVALAVDQNVTTEGTYEAPSTAAQVRIGTPLYANHREITIRQQPNTRKQIPNPASPMGQAQKK